MQQLQRSTLSAGRIDTGSLFSSLPSEPAFPATQRGIALLPRQGSAAPFVASPKLRTARALLVVGMLAVLALLAILMVALHRGVTECTNEITHATQPCPVVR